MRYKFSIIAVLTIFSSLLMIGLYINSFKTSLHSNNFNRRFLSYPIKLYKDLDIQYNSYYVAGASSSKIYLGNETAPWFILIADTALISAKHLIINNISKKNILSGRVSVDSPNFYLTDRIKRSILLGNIINWQVEKYICDSVSSDLTVPISNNSFAVRTFRNNTLEYALGKEITDSPFVTIAPNLLQKQADGLFSNDGMLNYDRKRTLLVYIYFYRNQYICIDTNLNLLYRGNTIDTTTKANIKVANIKSENSLTLSEPPKIVNLKSCVYDNNLFIISGLKADNESRATFNQSSVIDVYDLQKGVYKFSFYVPNFKGNKIKSFRVFNSDLITISDHYMLKYKLDTKYFYNKSS